MTGVRAQALMSGVLGSAALATQGQGLPQLPQPRIPVQAPDSCVCPDQKGGIDLRPWAGGGPVGWELPVSTSTRMPAHENQASLRSGWPLDRLLIDLQSTSRKGSSRFSGGDLQRPCTLPRERPARALCPTTALPPLLRSDSGLGAVASSQPPWTPSTGCRGLHVAGAEGW